MDGELLVGKLSQVFELGYGFKHDDAQAISQYLESYTEIGKQIKFSDIGKESLIEKINDFLQKNFLRRAGTERSSLAPLYMNEKEKNDFNKAFSYYKRELKVSTEPDIVLILGATENAVSKRINTFTKYVELFSKAAVFGLSGDRDLWIDQEPSTWKLLCELNNKDANKNVEVKENIDVLIIKLKSDLRLITDDNERQNKLNMFRAVLKKNLSDEGFAHWPTETDVMKSLFADNEVLKSKIVVEAKGKNGNRANTQDTYEEFSNQYRDLLNTTKNLTIVTNQPFGPNQCAIAKDFFSKEYPQLKISVVAQENLHFNAKEVKDSFARTIYAEKRLAKERYVRPLNCEHVRRVCCDRNESYRYGRRAC